MGRWWELAGRTRHCEQVQEAAGTRSRGWEVAPAAPGEPAPGVGHPLNPPSRLLDGVVPVCTSSPGDTAGGTWVASLL